MQPSKDLSTQQSLSFVDHPKDLYSSHLLEQAAVSHADSVVHMCALHSFGERLLLSGSADGIVKAWK